MSSHVAHQFDDAEQQFHSATLGMWLFLATEVMFFGGLFAGYLVYRWNYPAAFVEGSGRLSVEIFGISTGPWLGALNTAVLLVSSFLMALAVHAAQTSQRKRIVTYLMLTIAFGTVFLLVKGYEYGYKYAHHEVPGYLGGHFHLDPPPQQADPKHVEIFFDFYFAMTGLHALHMIIGVVLLSVMAVLAGRGRFSAEYFTPVEMSGLYWHFVDIVWVFLFPLLYLL